MNGRAYGVSPYAFTTRHKFVVVGVTGALVALGLASAPLARGADLAPAATVAAAARPSVALAPTTDGCTVDVTGTVRTCDLFAAAGSVTLPSGTAVNPAGVTTVAVWSYASTTGGTVGAVGRTLVVNQGDTVNIVLHNQLAQATGLELPQVDGFADNAVVPAFVVGSPAATHTYSITATRPGTFLYEAGSTPDASRQVAMGLVGALVVLPPALVGQPAGAPTTSGYGSAGTAYTDESVALLTDVDPALNNAVGGPSSFDMRAYLPKFHLLNGVAYPTTPRITVTAGTRALLRVVNGGIVQHSLGVLGTSQTVVATSSRALTHPYGVAAQNISAGDVEDLLVDVPSTGGPLFPVYDSASRLDNAIGAATGVVPFGGALTFLDTGAAVATPPTITGLALSYAIYDGTDLGFTATATPGSDGVAVDSIQWVLDSAAGTPTTAAAANGPVSGTVAAATIAALANGGHSLLVRAHSGTTYGAWTAASFVVDKAGPVVSGLGATPTVTSAGSTTLTGNVSDSATGGSAVATVTVTVDGAAQAPIPILPAGSVAGSFSAVLSLSQGLHTITVVGTDVRGNTGPISAPVTVTVDTTVPTVTAVTVSPSPNDGNQGTPADPTIVEVRATVTDPAAGSPSGASGVVAGEAFLGGAAAPAASATGTGFPLYPYPAGSLTTLLGNFPVSELTKYPDGPLNVWVHAQDAAGNWGPAIAGTLVINRTGIFASTFSNGITPFGWTSAPAPTGRLSRTIAGGLTGQMVIARTTGTWTNFSSAYVIDASPAAETRYNAAFDLTAGTFTTGAGTSPNSLATATTNAQNNARIFTVFQARTAGGVAAFTVQYRAYTATKTNAPQQSVTARQVRLVVGGSVTAWQTIPATATRIGVLWVSGASATATLQIGGATVATLNGLNTSANTIDFAWLGVSAITGGGTANIAAVGTSMSFDNFNSVRTGTP